MAERTMYERMAPKIRWQGDCHIWMGAKSKTGIGMFYYTGRAYRVVHFAYEEENGPLPARTHLGHSCGEHACMNPRHLKTIAGKEVLRHSRRVRLDELDYSQFTGFRVDALKILASVVIDVEKMERSVTQYLEDAGVAHQHGG